MLTVVQRGGGMRGKPPQVVRGMSSRLPWAWDGLCFAVPFHEAAQGSARDLVWGAPPSVITGLAWSRDNRGNTAAYLDASSYLDYPDNPAHNTPSAALTAYIRFRRAGAGDWPGGGIFVKRHGAVDPWLSWGITNADTYDNALMGYLTVGGVSYGFEDQSTPVQLTTTPWVSAFLRWQSGTEPRLDVLGERGETLESFGYGSTLSGSISYTAGEPIRVNTTDDVAYNFNADYSQAMLWSRRLTDTELQALVEDPYGWYSPRRSTVSVSSPYAVPFGGGELRGGTGQAGGLH